MKKIKKFFNNFITVITAALILLVGVAWILTIINLGFGLAIWSTKWLWGMF